MSWLSKLLGKPDISVADYPPLPAGVDSFLPGGKTTAFRASKTMVGVHPSDGGKIFRSGCATSMVSRDEAQQLAGMNAERNLARALRGEGREMGDYAYAVQRNLEPIVETLGPPGEQPAAKVTINSYGALIVNAASALFVDVDTRSAEDAPEDASANERAAESLRVFVVTNPELGFRVYRTRNGWRYLCTSRPFDPASDETRNLLTALGADDRYIKLCRVQRCFRARLTPKPWRIGCRFFDVQPTEAIAKKRFERYLRNAAPYASARFTGTAGHVGPVAPALQMIADHHDAWCAANSSKPLA